jgi:hypothetical protein
MVNSVTLSFTPASLSFGSGLSQDVIDAYGYTLTKAQMTARAAGADPAGRAYFEAMVGELRHLGWSGVSWQAAPLRPFTHEPGGTPVSPLALALEAIGSFLGQTVPLFAAGFPDVQWLPRFVGALEQVPPGIAAGLDRWWSGIAIHAAGRTMSVSSLATVFGTTFIAGGYFVYDFAGSSWRALLQPTANVGLTSYPMVLQLDMSVYRGLEAQLQAELKDEFTRTIYRTPLDLGAEGTWQEA